MSVVDDIAPDEMCTMTAQLDRAFRALDCEPECHCCEKPILIGHKFKLAYIKRPEGGWIDPESTDEMLCYHCSPAKLLAMEKVAMDARDARRSGGFTRPHHITSEFYGGVRF